jgi:ribonuclease P protein subunit POP4
MPSTLIYHELIGLEIKVIHSTNPVLIGVLGRVIDETKNMLIVKNSKSRELKIPKADSEFLFRIPAELSEKGRRSDTFVKIQGNLLLSQPENRIKNIKKLRKWG